jgi:hypothetical protein
MAAPENTKLQVNFKAPDGTLVNLYAANKEELEALLTAAQDFAPLIGSVSQSFSGARPAAAVHNPAPAVNAPAAPAPAGAHTCRHGAMRYQEGVGAKGPWKGYMCASAKGTPIADKCQTIWVR